MTEQEKYMKTIKERNINVKISDADLENLANKCGLNGMTIGELLENFISDLVGQGNGSDERDRANSWFERCWFSWMNDNTLIHHLFEWGHDVDDFLTTYDELKYFEANPQEYVEEIAELEEGEQHWFQKDYHEYVDEYLEKNKDIDMDEEIALCRKWLKEVEELKGE